MVLYVCEHDIIIQACEIDSCSQRDTHQGPMIHDWLIPLKVIDFPYTHTRLTESHGNQHVGVSACFLIQTAVINQYLNFISQQDN